MSEGQELPQAGIFALGTASHAYLELDLREGGDARELVTRLADLREPRTTIGGVNLVAGLRPELWRDSVGATGAARLRRAGRRSGRVHDAGHPA